MDETTFQRELQLLKHRVAQMTSTFRARPPYVLQLPLVCNDAFFSDQLFDVKARLQAMEASIDALHATPRRRQGTQCGLSSPPPPQPQHNRLALPSGPLFWQLFTSLRTDVQGLHGRVADVEQSLSDLEDRVDKFDPSYQCTPPGSENNAFSSFGWSQQNQAQLYPAQEQQLFAAEATYPGIDCPYSEASWPTTNPVQYHSRDSLWGNIELPATPDDHTDLFPSSQHPAPEGVAFRDREIARLEELVRDAQDSLRSKEDMLGQKGADISILRSERSRQDARIKELDRINFERASQVQCYGGILAERQREVEKLEEDCRAKDRHLNAWEVKFQEMQQSFIRKKVQLSQAYQELQHLKRENAELRDVDETVAAKDMEITDLRDFCEAKDLVAQQQEQIISRGATLIEEKDRLLKERDEEIEQLKKSLHQALLPGPKAKLQEAGPPARADRSPPVEAHVEHGLAPYSPFATVGARSAAAVEWAPKAFKNSAMLPHESLRASVWDTGRSSSDHYKFGVPGVATPSPNDHKVSRDERRELRRSDSVKLLQRLALAEESETRSARPAAAPGKTANRTTLPLEEFTARPLPAPLPPRKMSSLEGLSRNPRHAINTDRLHMSIPHHELPQRPLLQAYVEEGESGGERKGDE